MTNAEERKRIKKAYKGGGWVSKVNKMTDDEVHAIYIRLKQQNKV